MNRNNISSVFENMLMYANKAYEAFLESEKFAKLSQLALESAMFNLAYVGEVANQSSKEFRMLFPSINWNVLIRTRHLVFHNYGDLDTDQARESFMRNIKDLQEQFLQIIKLNQRGEKMFKESDKCSCGFDDLTNDEYNKWLVSPAGRIAFSNFMNGPFLEIKRELEKIITDSK